MKSIKNLPLLIAIILIGVAGFGFFSIIQSLRNDVTILVAKTPLSAYTFVKKSDFNTLDVPEAAVTDDMMTEQEYNDLFLQDGNDTGTVLLYPFLKGQWIVQDGLSLDPESTYAVLLEDEAPSAVTASVTGAGLGTIRPGDVVTARALDGDYGQATEVEYAKVLCLTTSPTGCKNILPDNAGQESPNSTEAEGSFYVILGVPRNVASSLTGNQVTMTQEVWCNVGPLGQFVGSKCGAANSDRLAAADLKKQRQEERLQEQDAAVEDAAAGDTTTEQG